MSDSPSNSEMEGINEEYDLVVSPQPRQPRGLEGLLRFAMEATKAEDAPEPTWDHPMDEERRKFLEEALGSMTVDVAEMLQNAINNLTNEEVISNIKRGSFVPDDTMSMLNVISEFVDDIDAANDFRKLGGFSIFPICLSCEHDDVKSRVSVILGTVCQNNPECQDVALQTGILNLLICIANDEYKSNKTGTLLSKYIYALSCIVRGYEAAVQMFVDQNGLELVFKAFFSNNVSSKTRVAFFAQELFKTNVDAKEFFVDRNLLKLLAHEINAGQNRASEQMLGLLNCLLDSGDKQIIEQCNALDLDLKKVIQDHLVLVEDDEGCIEEKDFCLSILNMLEENSKIDPNMPDDR